MDVSFDSALIVKNTKTYEKIVRTRKIKEKTDIPHSDALAYLYRHDYSASYAQLEVVNRVVCKRI